MEPSSTSTSSPDRSTSINRTVLLVDDDDAFRSALAETLRDDGYEVFDYGDPLDVPALQSLTSRIGLITDYRMRSIDGVTFADRFHAAHPDGPVIVVTSYSTAPLESEVAARPYMSLLCKPVDYAAIVKLLE